MNTKRVRLRFPANNFALLLLAICFGLFSITCPLQATTVQPPTFDELVNKSDYIVRAVVKSVTSELHNDALHRHIITKVELNVREVIGGTPPQPLVLTILGGKVGEEEMFVDGTPKFQVGDEDILFVHGNGVQFCPLVALLHGRYPVKRDATTGLSYVTRGDGTPLTNEQQVVQPLIAAEESISTPIRPIVSALTPDNFVSRIKASRAKNTAMSKSQP